MPAKKKQGAALPESPFSRIENDPMRFLYGNDDVPTVPTDSEKPLEAASEAQSVFSEIEEIKKKLDEALERAQRAERKLQDAEKRITALKQQAANYASKSQSFTDPYGDEFEWLLNTSGEGHSTLRMTPIYTRVYNEVNEQLKQHVGVSVASPQFIGLACCAFESLLKASNVDWKGDFKGLKDRVKTRNQTILLRRLYDVMRRSIKPV